MKVWALWNVKRKGYYSTGHGTTSGVFIVNFATPEEAIRFRQRINAVEDYIIKGVSVGG